MDNTKFNSDLNIKNIEIQNTSKGGLTRSDWYQGYQNGQDEAALG